MLYNYLLDNFLNSYSFSILIINILIYSLSTSLLFFIFFFFNLDTFINLNNIKTFSSNSFFYSIVIMSLLSLLGMPPMSGFSGKFLMSLFIILKSNFFFFLMFVIINLFMIYFYIQNFRFIVKKSSLTSLNLSNNQFYINYKNYIFTCFIFFFLLFGIFFLDDLLIIISSLFFF